LKKWSKSRRLQTLPVHGKLLFLANGLD